AMSLNLCSASSGPHASGNRRLFRLGPALGSEGGTVGAVVVLCERGERGLVGCIGGEGSLEPDASKVQPFGATGFQVQSADLAQDFRVVRLGRCILADQLSQPFGLGGHQVVTGELLSCFFVFSLLLQAKIKVVTGGGVLRHGLVGLLQPWLGVGGLILM